MLIDPSFNLSGVPPHRWTIGVLLTGRSPAPDPLFPGNLGALDSFLLVDLMGPPEVLVFCGLFMGVWMGVHWLLQEGKGTDGSHTTSHIILSYQGWGKDCHPTPTVERYPTEGVRSPLMSSGHGDLFLTVDLFRFNLSEVVTDGHTPILGLDPDLVTTETLRGDVLDGHQVRTWYQ